MDLFILSIIASLGLLGLAAMAWGVDSRPTDLDPRHRSTNGLF